MKLSDTDIGEFIQIIKDDYGVDLTPEQAREEARSMLKLAHHILLPPPQ